MFLLFPFQGLLHTFTTDMMMREMRPNRYSTAYGLNSTSNYTGYVANLILMFFLFIFQGLLHTFTTDMMMRAMRPNRYSAAYGTNSTSNYTGYVANLIVMFSLFPFTEATAHFHHRYDDASHAPLSVQRRLRLEFHLQLHRLRS